MLSSAYPIPLENANHIIGMLPGNLKYMPLGRRDEDNGGGWTPLRKLPGNLPEGTSDKERELAFVYWKGWPCTDDDIREAMAAGCGLAVLPERSGLIILDCDIRQDFVLREDGSAALEVTEDGMQDLEKKCADIGEILPLTYTVRTPSGGRHLYYQVRPERSGEVIRSTGHRKGWCIDVKASRNTWAVAAPTAGYVPECAQPIACVPYKLARFLRGGVQQLPPRTQAAGEAGRIGRGMGLAALPAILRALEEATERTGMNWNILLFKAACRYGEDGITDEQAMSELLEVARPWDDGERARAVRTIKSGLRNGREQESE